jgi:hypothetical protein
MDRTTFYATMAQVIPIAFLALVFQVKLLEIPRGNPLVTVALLYGLVVSEIVALGAVYSGKDSELIRALVIAPPLLSSTQFIWLLLFAVTEVWCWDGVRPTVRQLVGVAVCIVAVVAPMAIATVLF